MVSSTVGGSTITVWKRRSSAPSFSMYLRYSLRVEAPTHCSSPRASAGFNMLDASTAPSAAPAPPHVLLSIAEPHPPVRAGAAEGPAAAAHMLAPQLTPGPLRRMRASTRHEQRTKHAKPAPRA